MNSQKTKENVQYKEQNDKLGDIPIDSRIKEEGSTNE